MQTQITIPVVTSFTASVKDLRDLIVEVFDSISPYRVKQEFPEWEMLHVNCDERVGIDMMPEEVVQDFVQSVVQIIATHGTVGYIADFLEYGDIPFSPRSNMNEEFVELCAAHQVFLQMALASMPD